MPPEGLRAAMMASVAQVRTLNICAPTVSAPRATDPSTAVCAAETKNPNTTSSPDTWNSASSRDARCVRAHHAASASSATPHVALCHQAVGPAPNVMDRPNATSNRKMHTNSRLNGPGNEPGFGSASSRGGAPSGSASRRRATGPATAARATAGRSA